MRTFALLALLALTGCATTGVPADTQKLAEGYYDKGLSYLQEKNYELASVEFNRSIQTDSDYRQAYFGLGTISAEQGKLDDAIKYFKEAIDRDSRYSEAYNALGAVYARQRDWKDALKCFRKALDNKLYATPHIPNLNIGLVYMEMKDYNRAVEAFRESKRFVNQDMTNFQLGRALFEAGRIKESVVEFREGVGQAPQNAAMRYSLAVALLKDGSKKSALAEFKKAAELAPKSEIARKANDYIKTLR
ncbi:MAG TPA: tetratricopeptide repeat protein [Nitrospirota bacterium]